MNVDVTFEGDNTVLMQQVSVSAVESEPCSPAVPAQLMHLHHSAPCPHQHGSAHQVSNGCRRPLNTHLAVSIPVLCAVGVQRPAGHCHEGAAAAAAAHHLFTSCVWA